jgi:hypothetical protein
MQQEQTVTRTSKGAGAVMAVGGLVASAGAFMTWVKVDLGRVAQFAHLPSGSRTASGLSAGTDGKIVLACGVVLLAAGILAAVTSSRGARRAMAIVAIVAGLAAAGTVPANLATKDAQINDQLRKSAGRTLTTAEFNQAKAILERLGFRVSWGIGVYVSLVGGLIGLIGGGMGLASKSRAPAAPAVAGAPNGASAGSGGWDTKPVPAPPVLPAPQTVPAPEGAPPSELSAPGEGAGA